MKTKKIKAWAVVDFKGKPVQELSHGYEIYPTKTKAEYSMISRLLKVKSVTITVEDEG